MGIGSLAWNGCENETAVVADVAAAELMVLRPRWFVGMGTKFSAPYPADATNSTTCAGDAESVMYSEFESSDSDVSSKELDRLMLSGSIKAVPLVDVFVITIPVAVRLDVMVPFTTLNPSATLTVNVTEPLVTRNPVVVDSTVVAPVTTWNPVAFVDTVVDPDVNVAPLADIV